MESTVILRKGYSNHIDDGRLQIVLLSWTMGETIEFSTHLENSGGEETFYVEGHYFRDFNQALFDFNNRGLLTLYHIKGV